MQAKNNNQFYNLVVMKKREHYNEVKSSISVFVLSVQIYGARELFFMTSSFDIFYGAAEHSEVAGGTSEGRRAVDEGST